MFHNLIGDGFNVDHVLIGPGGVFTVETKSYSKPASGPAEISFNGEQVAIGGWQLDRNPVIQARAQAGWLRALLKETTGRGLLNPASHRLSRLVRQAGWASKNATMGAKH